MKKYQVFTLIALMFATVFVFYPVLKADFIDLDDAVLVSENAKIQSLNLQNIFQKHYGLFHPIVNLSYALEYHFFGNDPYFYHADNLILHLINILLVFFIFFAVTKRNFFISVFVAVIFACHPMHVEPVAWISARKDTLYALFFLSSLLLYIKSLESEGKKRIIRYILSLVLFLCACLSKPMAVTLPFILILFDWLTGKKFDFKSLLRYVPFVLVTVFFSVLAYIVYYDKLPYSFTGYSYYMNFIAAHFNVLFYLVKFIIPSGLAIAYPYFLTAANIDAGFVMKAPALVYALILLSFFSIKYTKKIFFGFIFFILTLLPSINIIPVGISPTADRYTYIPFIGLAYIAACAVYFIYGKLRVKYLKRVFTVLVCCAFAVMLIQSNLQAQKWENSDVLFEDQIKKYPGESKILYDTLGDSYMMKGDLKKAEKYILEAERISSAGEVLTSLGRLKMLQERYQEALKYYSKVVYPHQNAYIAYLDSVEIYNKLGDNDKSLELLREMLPFAEDPQKIYYLTALFNFHMGNLDLALENIGKAKTFRPLTPSIVILYAEIIDKKDGYEAARSAYFEALKEFPDDAAVLNAFGNFYYDNGFDSAALVLFKKGAELFPENYLFHDAIGNIYSLDLDYNAAVIEYTRALLSKNDYAISYFHRAAASFELKRYEEAREDALKAQSLGFKLPEDFIRMLKIETGILKI